MNLRVLYHGHCFDGVASAATFTRFYKERIHPDAEVNYTGLLHRPGNLFDFTMFDSDENAIVDFKSSKKPIIAYLEYGGEQKQRCEGQTAYRDRAAETL